MAASARFLASATPSESAPPARRPRSKPVPAAPVGGVTAVSESPAARSLRSWADRVRSWASATVVLADSAWTDKRGLAPTARLVSYGIAAVEPGMFGLGPVPAVKQALRRAGWDIRSIERAEINEAFAAIAIIVARELGLPEDIVNVEGGAVAMVIRSAPPVQY